MNASIHHVSSVEVTKIDSDVCRDTGTHVRKITITDEKGTEFEFTLFSQNQCNLKIEL